jgi:hypothetical protein
MQIKWYKSIKVDHKHPEENLGEELTYFNGRHFTPDLNL